MAVTLSMFMAALQVVSGKEEHQARLLCHDLRIADKFTDALCALTFALQNGSIRLDSGALSEQVQASSQH